MKVLSEDDLDEIVSMSEEGASLREIADVFEVSIPTVRKVLEDYEGEEEEDLGDDFDEDDLADEEDEGGTLTFVGAEDDEGEEDPG